MKFHFPFLLFLALLGSFSCEKTPKDTSTTISDHFTPYPNEVATIESGVAPSTMAGQAMKLYEEERYDQAIILFNELIQSEGSPEKRYSWVFYKGNAEMAQDQYQNALSTFSYLPADHPLYEDAQWYRGLLLLQLNQIKEAKTAFQQIKKAHSRFEEARRVIRKFNL
jgi:tetratricopeptide (TPR) repeat protein